jgi:multidrug efflux pump subunit AcrA (membrane-fusion protein)
MITLGVLVMWPVLTGCGGGEPETAAKSQQPAASVVVERLALVETPETYEVVGTIRPQYSALVSSRMTGAIQQVHVRAGDAVRQGQLLVELDARDFESNLRQAEAARAEVEDAILEASHAVTSAQAQLHLAEVTHQRYAGLLEKKSVSRQEYDEAEARLNSARAAAEMAAARKSQAEAKRGQADSQIASARIGLGYAKILAPFAGLVTERMLDPGSLATPGVPILSLDQAGVYVMEAAVPESRLRSVKTGQQVTVRIDALAESFSGQVSEIVPALDASSRTFTAKIALPRNAKLRSGLFGRATFTANARQALTVAADAVMERGQIQSVFVAEDGTAHRRLVSLGSLADGRYEVLAGLESGEEVVTQPSAVQDGQPIEIRETVSPPGSAVDQAAGGTDPAGVKP